MPYIATNQFRTFYRLEGNDGLPVLILSHSIGTDHAMWNPQVPELLSYFQVLRYDTRGHGASDAPAAEYSIEQLGQDVLSLVDALEIRQFAFCGLSLGGEIGQWLALHAGHRLSHLILANTSPRIGTAPNWQARIEAVRNGGMTSIIDLALQRYFSSDFLSRVNPSVATTRSVLLATNPAGYIGCCAALRDSDVTASLSQINIPTLVIGGDKDVSTPWQGNGEILAREIPGARAIRLPAAHLSNLESPRAFLAAMFSFLLTPAQTKDDIFRTGMQTRRAVLGNEHVDRAIARTTEFTADFQKLITEYPWGTIWTRPGLDRRTRRLLVLASTASLGRWEEFRLHLTTGLKNGLELCDIEEVLLQIAIYAGVPAANTGFYILQEEVAADKNDK